MTIFQQISNFFRSFFIPKKKKKGKSTLGLYYEMELERMKDMAKFKQKSEDRKYELFVLTERAYKLWEYRNRKNNFGIPIIDPTISGYIYTIHDADTAKYYGEGGKAAEKEYIDAKIKEIEDQNALL